MPIKVIKNLPAITKLAQENIFVMDTERAETQQIRPLNILLINLMPTKEVTETQILRALSNSPLQVNLTLLHTASRKAKNTDEQYLDTFYRTFDEVKDGFFDGMIITGAPLDYTKFEDVDYWDELTNIMEWSKKHVHCTLYMCWAAFAGLYYHYGIERVDREEKLSGVYKHRVLKKSSPLFRGFDDIFDCPQSRAMTVNREDVEKIPELEVLAVSDAAGVAVIKTEDSRQFFMTGHLEYDSDTLAKEYFRDLDKGMNPSIPANYFPDDDPEKKPVVRWRSAGQLFYSNWLNYYVYQSTPYDVRDINK